MCGIHLLENTKEQLKWTAEQLKKTGLRYLMRTTALALNLFTRLGNGWV